MAFRLYEHGGAVTEYGDRAAYAFNPSGLLVITDEDGTRLTFSATSWHHLEDWPGGAPTSSAFR